MTTNKELEKQVNELKDMVLELQQKISMPAKSIQKVEKHDKAGEPPPKVETALKMNDEEKITSMRNAIKILPPNLVDGAGRHSTKNVGAICGFVVTEEMLSEAYQGIRQ